VQLEPLQGKVDAHRLALTSQKMADSNQNTSNPPGQTANPRRVLPDAPEIVSFAAPLADGEFDGGGEAICPLWYGHIIDATFPLV
jgi:hypothetical protein